MKYKFKGKMYITMSYKKTKKCMKIEQEKNPINETKKNNVISNIYLIWNKFLNDIKLFFIKEISATRRQTRSNNIDANQNWAHGNDTNTYLTEPTPHSTMYAPHRSITVEHPIIDCQKYDNKINKNNIPEVLKTNQ